MKYITYEHNGDESYGILLNENVYSIHEITNGAAPNTLSDFIVNGFTLPSVCEIKSLKINPVPLDSVKIKAPIPYPRREIICLGRNYEDHIKEIKATSPSSHAIPEAPVYFGKSARPAIGHNDIIPSHKNVTSQLDYEVELAVVIGKTCDNICEEDAYDYIFGYTILNDVTARDLQRLHNQWYLGKSLSGFCPMGPVIADKTEITSPGSINLCSRVNGELRQNSNTRFMIFNIPYIICQLSKGFKLLPGDIIATGTPAGVGHGFDPPKNLQTGDIIECEIEGIGILRNNVI